ncbi:MAG: hypothetical protein ACRDVE_18280 [Actinocrinis sp.]
MRERGGAAGADAQAIEDVEAVEYGEAALDLCAQLGVGRVRALLESVVAFAGAVQRQVGISVRSSSTRRGVPAATLTAASVGARAASWSTVSLT